MSKKLRLIGAGTYSYIPLRKEPFNAGDEIDVSDEQAKHLLEQTYQDRANRHQPIWQDVTPEQAAPAKKATRKRRKPAAAPADAE